MSDPLHVWTVHHLLVCVPSTLAPDRRAQLRTLLAERPSIDGVLDVLTADGLAATVPFACAEVVGTGTRVVIRGDLEAVAHGIDGSTVTLGAGRSSTWNDDVVTDITAISLDLDDGGRFEWLVPVDVDAAAPAPPAPPAPAALPAVDPTTAEVPVVDEPVLDEPVEEAAHTLDEGAFARLVGDDAPAPRPPSEGLDFSSLLEHTRARPTPAPPAAIAPVPTPAPSPDPAPEPVTVTVDATAVAPLIDGLPKPPSPPPPPPPPLAPDTGTGLGERDGRTITLADLRRLQDDGEARPPASTARVPDAAPARPSEVRAVRCPAGHANPLTTATCRACGLAITDQTVVVAPRPAIARLVFASGLVVEVDRPQLIGRRPTAPADVEELPNLVTVPSPDGDVSRAHTAIRIVGWDVLVEDVGSTNGTEVQAPGGELVRLREHEPVLAVVGTEVTLARTIRFTIEAPERS